MDIQWLPSGLDLNPSDWVSNFENNWDNDLDGNETISQGITNAATSVGSTIASAFTAGVKAAAPALPSQTELVVGAVLFLLALILVLMVLGKVEAL